MITFTVVVVVVVVVISGESVDDARKVGVVRATVAVVVLAIVVSSVVGLKVEVDDVV